MPNFRYPTYEEILAIERRARALRARYVADLIASVVRRLKPRLAGRPSRTGAPSAELRRSPC